MLIITVAVELFGTGRIHSCDNNRIIILFFYYFFFLCRENPLRKDSFCWIFRLKNDIRNTIAMREVSSKNAGREHLQRFNCFFYFCSEFVQSPDALKQNLDGFHYHLEAYQSRLKNTGAALTALNGFRLSRAVSTLPEIT